MIVRCWQCRRDCPRLTGLTLRGVPGDLGRSSNRAPPCVGLFRVLRSSRPRPACRPSERVANLTGVRVSAGLTVGRAPGTPPATAPGSAVMGSAPEWAGRGVAPGSIGQPAGRGCGCHVGAERGGGPGAGGGAAATNAGRVRRASR